MSTHFSPPRVKPQQSDGFLSPKTYVPKKSFWNQGYWNWCGFALPKFATANSVSITTPKFSGTKANRKTASST